MPATCLSIAMHILKCGSPSKPLVVYSTSQGDPDSVDVLNSWFIGNQADI